MILQPNCVYKILVPSINVHNGIDEIGTSVTEFLQICKDNNLINLELTLSANYGVSATIMSSEEIEVGDYFCFTGVL